MARRLRSLSLRPAGLLPSLSRAFDTPLRTVGSLLPTGICFRALRRLPGRDFHPLEHRVFVQDAPWVDYMCRRGRAPRAWVRFVKIHFFGKSAGGDGGWTPVSGMEIGRKLRSSGLCITFARAERRLRLVWRGSPFGRKINSSNELSTAKVSLRKL